MNRKENRDFISKIESLVNPKDITAISFLGDMNRIFPLKMQSAMMKKGSEKAPYMGFVVDPYCFFLAFEIVDTQEATKQLPEGYELIKTSIFDSEPTRYLAIVSIFSAHTSSFTGVRFEMYTIAKNISTGMVSWIITAYETNTNSYDPAHGFAGYSTEKSVFTTTPYGELLIDIKSIKNSNSMALKADLKQGKFRDLYAPLWIEGNLSIDYGRNLRDESSSFFSLIFDPVLMKEALEIPIDSLEISEFACCPSIIDPSKPVTIACFPYAQHYMIDTRKNQPHLFNKSDVEKSAKDFITKEGFKRISGDDIKRPLFRGLIISTIINWLIIISLLLLLFVR